MKRLIVLKVLELINQTKIFELFIPTQSYCKVSLTIFDLGLKRMFEYLFKTKNKTSNKCHTNEWKLTRTSEILFIFFYVGFVLLSLGRPYISISGLTLFKHESINVYL